MIIFVVGAAAALTPSPLRIDVNATDKVFDGIGGLSGGGATSRLLVDYKEPQRSQILDYLFKPNFGASLQILKVEIGGDSQSTDGTESSHMHDNHTVDLNTGYEWWLMQEAKKRNPDIKLYGLPWAYPGWVGDDPINGSSSGSPFAYPNQTSRYVMEWIKGARDKYDLDIDYIGIWNERASSPDYAAALRRTLDSAGFGAIKVVAKDGGADICDTLTKDPAYAKTVDIIGLHYPSDYQDYSTCHALGKPLWASEESSSYDDLNGAACWARITNAHYVLSSMTSSIMWNLVGAYYHGTNWYASSMLTAVQPWSGHYDTLPVVWATAHVTQFSDVGWRYLKTGSGSGELPNGGFYTTLVSPSGGDLTLQVIKIDHEHAPCTRPSLPAFNVSAENVTFTLPHLARRGNAPRATLACWRSNFLASSAILFEQQPDIVLGADGSFELQVVDGDYFTISTVRTARKGGFGSVPASAPSFPLPHAEDFQSKPVSQEAALFADQIGAFEVHLEGRDAAGHAAAGNKVLRQMVPELPIGWSDHGSNGPMTLIGMREWHDVTVSVGFKLPAAAAAACVATRIEQMWKEGLVVCVGSSGAWNLTYGGPPQNGVYDRARLVAHGQAHVVPGVGHWHTLSLTTVDDKATASIDGAAIFTEQRVRTLDTGFAAIGTNAWYPIEFDDFHVEQAGGAARWTPQAPASCGAPAVGKPLTARPCQANGVAAADQSFELIAQDWKVRHVPSGLCVTADEAQSNAAASLSLQKCEYGSAAQSFVNDYTRIRNAVEPLTMPDGRRLTASLDGGVYVSSDAKPMVEGSTSWNTWSFFPNTNQLRNQYVPIVDLGYPMCLSTCATAAS